MTGASQSYAQVYKTIQKVERVLTVRKRVHRLRICSLIENPIGNWSEVRMLGSEQQPCFMRGMLQNPGPTPHSPPILMYSAMEEKASHKL